MPKVARGGGSQPSGALQSEPVVIASALVSGYEINGETWRPTGEGLYTNGQETKTFTDLKARKAEELGYQVGTYNYSQYMDTDEI